MYRKAADERMRELRGLSRLDEIARRIVGTSAKQQRQVKSAIRRARVLGLLP